MNAVNNAAYAIAGMAVGMALASLPRGFGILDFSGNAAAWVSVSVLALGGLAAFTLSAPAPKPTDAVSVRDRIRQRFPTASPTSVDWQDVYSSCDPVSWISSRGITDANGVRTGLESQVTDPVHPDILSAILTVLDITTQKPRYPRAAIDELARRMWLSNEMQSAFDLRDFVSWARGKYPGKSVHMSPMESLAGSPYGVVRVIEALVAARKTGAGIPSSDFLWVKLFDRRLWYVIDNVGRASFLVEGLGPMAHYMTERALGIRSTVVRIEGAYAGIEEYLAVEGLPPLPGMRGG